MNTVLNQHSRLSTLQDFCPDFCSDLHSGEVNASCQMSKPVCKFEMRDSIENRVAYYGQRLKFLTTDNDSVQSKDIKHDILSQFF